MSSFTRKLALKKKDENNRGTEEDTERGLQRWSQGGKRNVLRGMAGRRLRAVMLLLLFLSVTEHFIIGGFFSRSPPFPSGPPATIPIFCPSLPPGPPAASLIYWFSAAREAINHGNGGRR